MSIIRSYQANSNNKVINISYDYGYKNSNKQIRITNNVSEINILKDLSEQYGKKLTSIQSSATIYRIGPNCCKNAINLESFTGNVNLSEIMNDAFSGCSKLQSIIACGNVKRIGNNAFKDCSRLNNVEIGWNEIYSIGDNAFYNTAIKEVDISLNDNSTNGSSIFQNCTQLQTINIGKNFIIKSNTFSGCSNLTKLSIESNYGGLEGNQCLGNIAQIQQIVIPSSTSGFPDRCFINDAKLNNISFTDYKDSKFKHIGNSAFSGCTVLTDIELPSSFNTVGCFGSNCFSGSNITTVTLYGFTDEYILNNKTSITNFGAGHEIIYVSSSGKKYIADENGIKSSKTKVIICVNAINSEITDNNARRWHNALLMFDILKGYVQNEDDIILMFNPLTNTGTDLSKYHYIEPSGENLKNKLQEIINDGVENLIFFFEDHGGEKSMITSKMGTSNKTFWSYLKQIKGNKFCIISCCHAGAQAEEAYDTGNVTNYLMWCAAPSSELSYRTPYKCKYCNDSGHPSNKFTVSILKLFSGLKDKTYAEAWEVVSKNYGKLGVKYSNNFDESMTFLNL